MFRYTWLAVGCALAGCGGETESASDGAPLDLPLFARQHEIQAATTLDGVIAIAWTDDTSPTGLEGWTCRFSASDDGARTWSEPLTFKRDGYQLSGNPAIASDAAGTLYALCMSVDADYAKGSLDLATSSDGGKTWSPWRNVTARVDGIPDRPKLLAASDGSLHVVFTDVERTSTELPVLTAAIHTIRSIDGGATWEPDITLSRERQDPGGFIDGYQGASIRETATGELVVPWADYYGRGFHAARSDNHGEQFSPPIDVHPESDRFALFVPCTETAIDASGLDIVVTIHEGHAIGRTQLLHSADGGQTWQLGTSPSVSGTNFAIAYDSADRLHAVWLEHDAATMDTRYATSMDHGRTFSPSISLAGGAYPHRIPDDDEEFITSLGSYQSLVIGPDDRLYAFWLDYRAGTTSPGIALTTVDAR